jgi:hypothetical protein
VNKNLPLIILALIAVVVGLVISGVFKTTPGVPASLVVTPRVLEGSVAYPAQPETVRLAALAGGIDVAESAIVNNSYKFELPASIPDGVGFTALENVNLLHGEGRLKAAEGVKAADVKLVLYQDLNKNAKFDTGEPQLEGTLFQASANPQLQGYFKHKLMLLNGAASLNASQPTASGTPDYYRYKLDLKPGWVLLEGELTGGYDMREVGGSRWDVVLPLQKGGDGNPPTFTP